MTGSDDRLVLAVDLGSSGVKVGVATVLGEVLHWTYRPLRTRFGPGGAATQDAEEWWRCVVDAARQCLAEGPGDGSRARPTDAVSAARSFAVDVLHFTNPVVGALERGDARSGEVEVRPARTAR